MLEAVLATPPDNGQIVLNSNGSFLYTPTNGYFGTVTFTYRLSSSPANAPGITVTIIVDKPKSRIVINEIMYNALGSRPPEEYIEVHNAGSSEADLSGWKFSKGVSFKFPEETRLGSGKFLVVAADRLTFRTRYPTFQGQLFGNWTGQLANSGETLQLEDAEGKNRDEVTYDDDGDWSRRRTSQPHRGFTGWVWESLHDGQGRSLELINAAASNKTGQNWIASKFNGGTPGYANSQAEADVPPFIRDVRHWPILPTSNDTVSIHAKVDDDSGAPPTKVLLHWRVDGSSFFSQANNWSYS